MKTIENKETGLFIDKENKLTYADLLAVILNTPVPQGITFKQMKEDLALIAKVDEMKVANAVEVTDAELDKIKKLNENHLWATRHSELLEFSEYIDSL